VPVVIAPKDAEKSSIMFSRNTSGAAKQSFMEIMDIPQESVNEKYLGLPVYMGRSKKKTSEYLKDRVEKDSRLERKTSL
jgi:hypothetical protein